MLHPSPPGDQNFPTLYGVIDGHGGWWDSICSRCCSGCCSIRSAQSQIHSIRTKASRVENSSYRRTGASTTYGCSYFLNLHKATGHPVLVYMPSGRLAHDLENMSDEAAASFAFKQLKQILPNASEPIQYMVTHWGTDANSLSSYSYDKVGNPHELYERLRIPVDNIVFAGEATSFDYPGTVHGAFSTGLMAAEHCRVRMLGHDYEVGPLDPVMWEEPMAVPLLISRM